MIWLWNYRGWWEYVAASWSSFNTMANMIFQIALADTMTYHSPILNMTDCISPWWSYDARISQMWTGFRDLYMKARYTASILFIQDTSHSMWSSSKVNILTINWYKAVVHHKWVRKCERDWSAANSDRRLIPLAIHEMSFRWCNESPFPHNHSQRDPPP